MIERFNFYDVFGLFIPGSVLLLLLWLPIGLATGSLPSADLSAALITIIVGYVAGHFLQAWANRAFPLADRGRYPSSRALDEGERRFASQRACLVELLKQDFGIDVSLQAAASYRRYAVEFVQAVYRGFLELHTGGRETRDERT